MIRFDFVAKALCRSLFVGFAFATLAKLTSIACKWLDASSNTAVLGGVLLLTAVGVVVFLAVKAGAEILARRWHSRSTWLPESSIRERSSSPFSCRCSAAARS